ncbi:MAG: hypothetical protein JWO87_2610, partial [Phycisphaerales bacterium]|nr:hypothetical protein [Phycisphaerales bacterium]
AVELHAPELKEQFRQLIEVLARNSTPTDMGIRLLAYELQSKRYLFLWWD